MKKFLTALTWLLTTAMVLTLGGTATRAFAETDTRTASTPAKAAAAPKVTTAPRRAKARGGRYVAPEGPFFNNPRKGPRQQGKIERQILNALKHTKKGEQVRIALYSFDRVPVANALIAAHERGVRIQMLLNDHQDTKAMKMVRSVLGTNTKKNNFLYKCVSSCRGARPDRNLHSKFYLFSRAGQSDDVLMIGSHNFTRNALVHQWNDLYITSGNAPLFDEFVATFDDMKKDYNKPQPPMYYCGTPVGATCDDSVDKYTNWVFPRRSTRMDDTVLTMLNRVTCLTPDGIGGQTRTKLDLSMHTMRGVRGDYLARAIRAKYAEGCDFRVNYGLIGFQTKQILGAPTPRGRIPLRSTGYDFNPNDSEDLNGDGDDDVTLDLYTHQKYFIIQGTYNNVPNYSMVLTGSSNWASLGTAQDEVFFTVADAAVAAKYEKNYDLMWKQGNSRNAYTTTYANYRTLSPARDAEGHPTFTTERRAVTTIRPDGFRAGGKYWEGD